MEKEYKDTIMVIAIRIMSRNCSFLQNIFFIILLLGFDYYEKEMYISILFHTVIVTRIHVLLTGS